MSMLHWAHLHFPHLRYLIRADDDVYLRPGPLLQQLEKRPPVGAGFKGPLTYGWRTSKVNGPRSYSLVAWKRTIVGLDSTKIQPDGRTAPGVSKNAERNKLHFKDDITHDVQSQKISSETEFVLLDASPLLPLPTFWSWSEPSQLSIEG